MKRKIISSDGCCDEYIVDDNKCRTVFQNCNGPFMTNKPVDEFDR